MIASTPAKDYVPAQDAYEFQISFVGVIDALSGGIVHLTDRTPNGTRPHKVTVRTHVDAGKIGPFQLAKIPKARILVTADYRSARNGQQFESPFCDEELIDLPHFAQDFRFSDADPDQDDWSNYTGDIAFTLDFKQALAQLRPDDNKQEHIYGLTVTVKARFIDPEGKSHTVIFQDDPVPDTN